MEGTKVDHVWISTFSQVVPETRIAGLGIKHRAPPEGTTRHEGDVVGVSPQVSECVSGVSVGRLCVRGSPAAGPARCLSLWEFARLKELRAGHRTVGNVAALRRCQISDPSPHEEKPFYFKKKPLGFKFKESAPIIVSKINPGSHAEEIGLEAGMEVVSVGGEATEGKTYEDIMKLVVSGVSQLTPS